MKDENGSNIKKYLWGARFSILILIAIFSIIRHGEVNLDLMLNDVAILFLLGLLFGVCFLIIYQLYMVYLKLRHRSIQRNDVIAWMLFYFLFWGWFLVECAMHLNKKINVDMMADSIFYIAMGIALIAGRLWLKSRKMQENGFETVK
jgi:hypothetical protein